MDGLGASTGALAGADASAIATFAGESALEDGVGAALEAGDAAAAKDPGETIRRAVWAAGASSVWGWTTVTGAGGAAAGWASGAPGAADGDGGASAGATGARARIATKGASRGSMASGEASCRCGVGFGPSSDASGVGAGAAGSPSAALPAAARLSAPGGSSAGPRGGALDDVAKIAESAKGAPGWRGAAFACASNPACGDCPPAASVAPVLSETFRAPPSEGAAADLDTVTVCVCPDGGGAASVGAVASMPRSSCAGGLG